MSSLLHEHGVDRLFFGIELRLYDNVHLLGVWSAIFYLCFSFLLEHTFWEQT